ncbi:hypothetical protein DFH09DRAFT_1371198 [Mycena vulgaris]|nr:hypothetical protein DFH09DRAFT_1371198 [Mycena vulgaris]
MSIQTSKGLTIHPDGVTLTYGGSTTLTINPPIGDIKTISEGDSITVLVNDKPYEFSYQDIVVAKVTHHRRGDIVHIYGGDYHEATGPFTITVKLTH